MSGRRIRSGGLAVSIAASVALSACGGGQRQDANEPNKKFPVEVSHASFPAKQRLAQNSALVISVRNTGNATIPDVAVTISNPSPGNGTAASAFGQLLAEQSGLASRSRPVWIVDRPPGACQYSCKQGGPGGAVTAYANTWALGPLKPQQTATFRWGVTAVKAGTFQVRYVVAAGLNGKAKAIDSSGQVPTGLFKVTVSKKPAQAYVTNNGQVVTTQ